MYLQKIKELEKNKILGDGSEKKNLIYKVDKLNSADGLIFQTEKQLKEFGDKLSDENKNAIQKDLDKLKELHKDQNIEEIDGAIEALNKSWEGASQEIYKATQEQQAGQTSESEPGSADSKTNEKKGDDISDVDFEEVKDDDKK